MTESPNKSDFWKNKGFPPLWLNKLGASKGARTLDLSLGKAALYQLSYARTADAIFTQIFANCKRFFDRDAVLT